MFVKIPQQSATHLTFARIRAIILTSPRQLPAALSFQFPTMILLKLLTMILLKSSTASFPRYKVCLLSGTCWTKLQHTWALQGHI